MNDPIFIIGSGRSGTSLLRAMLNAHPRIYLLQEANFYPWARTLPFWWSNERKLEAYFQTFSYAWTGLDPESIRKALPKPLPRLELAFDEIMRQKAHELGKVRYGEKNPVNTYTLWKIFQQYPNARVIDVVRDPRAVMLSQRTMPWSTRSMSSLCVGMWIRETIAGWFKDRMLSIRLEDLVAEPRDTLRKVLEYVGEPWDEAVLTPWDPPDDGMPFPWLRVGKQRSKSSAQWQRDLSPAWIRLIERWSGDVLERFDYGRAELKREPTFWEMVKAVWWEDLPDFLESCWRTSVAAAQMLRWPGPKASQDIFLSINPRAWDEHPNWERPPDPPVLEKA